jgi:hypothetical protein
MITLTMITLSGFHCNVKIAHLGFVKYNYKETHFIEQFNRFQEEIVQFFEKIKGPRKTSKASKN